MAATNTPALAAIAAVAPRTAATQNMPPQAEAAGKPTFAQVLKSRSQAPEAPKPVAGKTSAKTEGGHDKADAGASTQEAETADAATAAALAAQTGSNATPDPALFLAAANAIATPAAPRNGGDVDEALTADKGTQQDMSLFATSTAAFAAQAASLAGKASATSGTTDSSPAQADGKSLASQIGADSELRPDTLKTGTEANADKLAANAPQEKSASFAAELANAGQNLEVNANPQATHGVLHGANRTADALPQHEVSTPVATRGWAEEVGQKVSWIANRDNGRAEIVLTPPSMGRVQVSISMSGDQASATFIAASPAAREALQDAMPRLREVLAQSGIQLGQANVNDGAAQQQQAQNENPGRRSPASRFVSPADNSLAPISSSRGGWTGSGTGMIDTFA